MWETPFKPEALQLVDEQPAPPVATPWNEVFVGLPRAGEPGGALSTESETFPSGLELPVAAGATGPDEEHWDPHSTGLPLLATGSAVRSKKVSASFTVGELVRSGGIFSDVSRISPDLVRMLQAMRDRVGKPVRITSGYRSWRRNGVVYQGYGKQPTRSRHCSGQAADITIAGLSGLAIAKLALDVWGPDLGVGIGANDAHVDVRPTWSSWTYLHGSAGKEALVAIRAYRAQVKLKKSGQPAPPVTPVPAHVVPGQVSAGRLVVSQVELLAAHRGTPPDLVLRWNDMVAPQAVDVVVHLHGFAEQAAQMRLDTDKLPFSGLDLGTSGSPVRRLRPTLAVLPRGHFYGGSSGIGYDFPALVGPGRLGLLVADALARFQRHTGVTAPLGRLILTAHSGGGKALIAILRHTDPDEVHIFDALYQPADPVAEWAERRLLREAAAPSAVAPALRVFYRRGTAKARGTQPASEAVGRRLCSVAMSPLLRGRFRVELTSEPHKTVAKRYGGPLLADAGADVSGVTRFACASTTPGETALSEQPSRTDASESLATYGLASSWSSGLEALDWQSFAFEDGEVEAFEPESFETESFESESFESESFESESFEPESFEPEAFEVESYEPESLEPESLEPDSREQGTFESEAFEPESYESESLEPESLEPESLETEAFEPESLETEALETEALEPEAFEVESSESESLEPESLEFESLEPESLEPEAFEPEAFEPESFEGERLDGSEVEGEQDRAAHEQETLEAESLDVESLVSPSLLFERFDHEDLAAPGLSGDSLVAEEYETEGRDSAETLTRSAGEAGDQGEPDEPFDGSTVAFPSGVTLRVAPASTALNPDYADPHSTRVPLLLTGPSTHQQRLSKNFTVRELASSGGQVSNVARISPALVEALQAIRDRAGRPVHVDSGYRSWARNVAVYRARKQTPTKSRHCSGQAADIRIAGMSGEQLARLAIDAAGPDLGIGIGSNYIHVDVRGQWTLWTYVKGKAGAKGKAAVQLHHSKVAPAPTPKKPTAPDARFSVVRPAILASTNAATRRAILRTGIAYAQGRATQVRRSAGDPTSLTSRTRARIIAETGVGRSGSDHPQLDVNPLAGRVTNDRFGQAYEAWAENPKHSVEPWMLMALWAKEGLTSTTIGPDLPADDSSDARAIWRSHTLYQNLGTDHYVKTRTVPGKDNDIDTRPGAGAEHDRVFRAAVTAKVKAGLLPRDITREIDRELTVTADPAVPKKFSVVASRRFFVLALMLTDAFWRQTRAAAAAEPLVVASAPTTLDLNGLTYLKWNMRARSWKALLNRDMTVNRDPDGTVPTLPVWALHREAKTHQFGQARANAIRFLLNVVVFESVYEGP